MQLDLLQTEEISDARPGSPQKPDQEKHPALPASLIPPVLESGHVPEMAEPGEEVSEEDKAPSAFKTISEAAKVLDVPQHVLRFWEGRFSQIKPLKMRGGRRYYRPEDMEILTTIKNLLYKQGYTIKGAKKAFNSRTRPMLPDLETIATAAVSVQPALELSDKQLSQIAVIRQELIGLRDTLKQYI